MENTVDPRIQVELEKLNSSTDEINRFEVELDEAKHDFKQLLNESVTKIKHSAHKIGNSIQAAKPYYEARLYAGQLTKETHQAAVHYEKARSIHSAAKEMVYLAEQGLGEKSTLDTACQEMLSHATSRVNESQLDCVDAMNGFKIAELKQEVANNRVVKLQSQLKGAIKASSSEIRQRLISNLLEYQHNILLSPYYETRANYNGLLKAQKEKITNLETKVSDAKMTYNDALKNLEHISEEIHKMRQERKNFINYENMKNSFEVQTRKFPDSIDSIDEYLDLPPKISAKSSPIHQKVLSPNECPHLLQDFEDCLQISSKSSSNYGQSSGIISDDIDQWTEIRLSNSESTSSGYSHHSGIDDQTTFSVSDSSTSSDQEQRKYNCTGVGNGGEEEGKTGADNGGGLTTWISRSSGIKNSGRRQSLEMLIDASDKVKDVFASSFQKVGKSLERRNSESEVNGENEKTEFFRFSRSEKDHLSDEQVENLLLNEACDTDDIVNGIKMDISKLVN